MFKLEAQCLEFMESGGMKTLAIQLNNNSDDLQLMYQTILNLWILSFNSQSHKYFISQDIKLIKSMIHVINIIAREKILRVAFGTFRVSLSITLVTLYRI